MKKYLHILAFACLLSGCVSNSAIDDMTARHAAQIEQAATDGAAK